MVSVPWRFCWLDLRLLLIVPQLVQTNENGSSLGDPLEGGGISDEDLLSSLVSSVES